MKCITCGSTERKGMVTSVDRSPGSDQVVKGPWCSTCYCEKVRVGYRRAVTAFQENHNERMAALKSCRPPTAAELKEVTERFNVPVT